MAVSTVTTIDEFLRQPEEQPALEFERGKITQKMAPLAWHGLIQGDLYARFRAHGNPEQLLTSFTETRVTWTVEGASYVPDVIAYRTERVPTDPTGEISQHLFEPPDIAVEIASPGQGLGQQQDRCRWYVAHGVPVALLIHPERRAVWIFRATAQPGSPTDEAPVAEQHPVLEQGPLQGDDLIDLGDVFAGLSFSVADLFSVLRGRRL